MRLRQLKILLAIVENGLNITAAADKLHTSQPGVSKQLKLLEEELGLQIFTRKGKSLGGITAAGRQVIERARIVMQEVENIRSVASDYYHEEEGTLSIATTRPCCWRRSISIATRSSRRCCRPWRCWPRRVEYCLTL